MDLYMEIYNRYWIYGTEAEKKDKIIVNTTGGKTMGVNKLPSGRSRLGGKMRLRSHVYKKQAEEDELKK